MIGKWMETLTDVELSYIADQPYEKWTTVVMRDAFERRCLVGHRRAALGEDAWACGDRVESLIGGRFDALTHGRRLATYRTPIPPKRDVVTMIQNRARKILGARKLAAIPQPETVAP